MLIDPMVTEFEPRIALDGGIDGFELYKKLFSQISQKKLPNGSFALLKEALFLGQFERGAAARITHYQERQARTILNQLVKYDLLTSESPKGPVRINFPISILEDWFPKLFLG